MSVDKDKQTYGRQNNRETHLPKHEIYKFLKYAYLKFYIKQNVVQILGLHERRDNFMGHPFHLA